MESDRERAYNRSDRQRSRWAVDAVRIGRREQPAAPGGETTVELAPLIRLTQEAYWNRLLNRPRRICQAEL